MQQNIFFPPHIQSQSPRTVTRLKAEEEKLWLGFIYCIYEEKQRTCIHKSYVSPIVTPVSPYAHFLARMHYTIFRYKTHGSPCIPSLISCHSVGLSLMEAVLWFGNIWPAHWNGRLHCVFTIQKANIQIKIETIKVSQCLYVILTWLLNRQEMAKIHK